MNLLHQRVDVWLALAGWALLLPVLWLAWRQVRHAFLPKGIVEHAWLGGAVCVAVLWLFAVRVGNGPAFGMLGSGLYALLFGRSRGMLGLALALLLHTGLNHGAWFNLGLNGLLFAVLPAMIAGSLQRQIETRLPHHLFVYIIGNGMFSTLAAAAITSVVLIMVSVAADASWMRVSLGQYMGPALLLAWSEAIVSGMVLSALVIFLPAVVLTYRQDLYLPRR